MDGELRVLCVKWGPKYGPEYVRNLQSAVARHLTLPHRFSCVTEDEIEGVNCIFPQCDYPGWWQKVGLFRPGFLTGPTLYLDLDLVIVGSLDWVARYTSCEFAAARDWGAAAGEGPKYPNELAGCLIVTQGDCAHDIYTRFTMSDANRLAPHGDQTWMTEVLGDRVTEIAPGRVMSYKRHCRDRGSPPLGCSVVAFHGRPNPDELTDHWVVANWR